MGSITERVERGYTGKCVIKAKIASPAEKTVLTLRCCQPVKPVLFYGILKPDSSDFTPE